MAIMEQMELVRYRDDISTDVRNLLEKYCAQFDRDVPRNDPYIVENLILGEIRKALGDIEKELIGQT